MGGVSLPKFNFFNVNPQISQQNCKVHHLNCLDTHFCKIPDICLRVTRCRLMNIISFLEKSFFLKYISGADEKSVNFTHATII